MVLFLVILFILFLLFCPIPLKFTISVDNNNYVIKIYKLILISNKDGLIRKILIKREKNKDTSADDNLSKDKERKKDDSSTPKKKKEKNKKLSPPLLIKRLYKNKFKPRFKFKGDVDFSLSDAANTALAYGFLSNLEGLFYFLFSSIFKVKRLNLNLNPKFKNENIINFTITSIICFNIAQIINIFYLIRKSYKII